MAVFQKRTPVHKTHPYDAEDDYNFVFVVDSTVLFLFECVAVHNTLREPQPTID